MSYINDVFRITEELIRIVNKLKKLIAKTMPYVALAESDEFLRQTVDLIWTKNVKFAKKIFFYAYGRWANGMKNLAILSIAFSRKKKA